MEYSDLVGRVIESMVIRGGDMYIIFTDGLELHVRPTIDYSLALKARGPLTEWSEFFQFESTNSPPLICGASPRSPKWKTVRDKHIKENPGCVACGVTKGLNAHHIRPYHLHPELELEPTNLVTLCESPAHNCHLIFGHLLNWSSFNADVVEDSKGFCLKVKNRPERG